MLAESRGPDTVLGGLGGLGGPSAKGGVMSGRLLCSFALHSLAM